MDECLEAGAFQRSCLSVEERKFHNENRFITCDYFNLDQWFSDPGVPNFRTTKNTVIGDHREEPTFG